MKPVASVRNVLALATESKGPSGGSTISDPVPSHAAGIRSPRLDVRDVSKRYGATRALRDVTFTVAPGEVAALLGENGAGKSTLARIISGLVMPDAGQVLLNGAPLSAGSPRRALERGVALVPQELSYVPHQTVAENICLGRAPSKAGFTSRAAMTDVAAIACDSVGVTLPLAAEITQVPIAMRQLAEIVKAVTRAATVLVLDEPTAALEATEVRALFRVMRTCASRGMAVIYVTHRIDEVMRECRSAHVLRDGRLVGSVPVSSATPQDLVRMIIGSDVEVALEHRRVSARPPAIRLEGWTTRRSPRITDISLTVEEGEILGLYGLLGCGATTIAAGLAGLRGDIAGSLVVGDRRQKVFPNPRIARKAGVLSVPPERRSQGLFPNLTVGDALTLMMVAPSARGLGIRNRSQERHIASALIDDLAIKTHGATQAVSQLSGGNQQKVLIGSRLAAQPRALVLEEPTRGVDVGARIEIHRLLRRQAELGAAILLVTSDVEEAVTVPHRLLIMRHGHIVREVGSPTEADQASVLSASGGIA